MAHWEYVKNENNHLVGCKCSECERVVYENAPYQAYIFCPRCGVKITEQPKEYQRPTKDYPSYLDRPKKTEKKKRKYFRKCGICGERHEQSEMIRTDESPNGWMCLDCHNIEFPQYDMDEF